MRILLTGQPIYSHLVPALVPVAQVARALGHDVAIATAASMADELDRHSVPHLPLRGVPGQAELRTDPALADRFGLPHQLLAPGSRRVEPAVSRQIAQAYAGPIALNFAENVLDLAQRWRPDVIVHEPAEFGGYLAAEVLGIPHVTMDISPFALRDLALVGDVLDAQRVALGLAAVRDPLHIHRYLRAGLLPESWHPAELRLPTARYYRLPDVDSGPTLQQSIAALPADRPFVLASLGSMLATIDGMAALLPTIVAALGELDCYAVVTLGGLDELAGVIGTLPANVSVASFVPQRALLGACDLFVTHAGFNSIVDAIAAGVALVALPAITDGPANAARVAELGLGRWVDIERLTTEMIVTTCRDVLGDASYGWRVRAMRRELLASPGLDRFVGDLTELVGQH